MIVDLVIGQKALLFALGNEQFELGLLIRSIGFLNRFLRFWFRLGQGLFAFSQSTTAS